MDRGEDVAEAFAEKEKDDQAHDDGESSVDAAGGLDAARVEEGDEQNEGDDPERVGNAGNDVARSLAGPDDADDRVEDVVHQHGPADDVAGLRVDLFGDVAEGGTGARIDARHASITDCGKEHGDHADQDGGDDVAAGDVADDAVDAHRGRGLDDDDAVGDKVPELQRAFELGQLVRALDAHLPRRF